MQQQQAAINLAWCTKLHVPIQHTNTPTDTPLSRSHQVELAVRTNSLGNCALASGGEMLSDNNCCLTLSARHSITDMSCRANCHTVGHRYQRIPY